MSTDDIVYHVGILFPVLRAMCEVFVMGGFGPLPRDIVRIIYLFVDPFYVEYHVLNSVKTKLIQRKCLTLFPLTRTFIINSILAVKKTQYTLLNRGLRICKIGVKIESLIFAKMSEEFSEKDYKMGPIDFDVFITRVASFATETEERLKMELSEKLKDCPDNQHRQHKIRSKIDRLLKHTDHFSHLHHIITESVEWSDMWNDLSKEKQYPIEKRLACIQYMGIRALLMNIFHDLYLCMSLGKIYTGYFTSVKIMCGLTNSKEVCRYTDILDVACNLIKDSQILRDLQNGIFGPDIVLMFVELFFKSIYSVFVSYCDGSHHRFILPAVIRANLISCLPSGDNYYHSEFFLKFWGVYDNRGRVLKYAEMVCEKL